MCPICAKRGTLTAQTVLGLNISVRAAINAPIIWAGDTAMTTMCVRTVPSFARNASPVKNVWRNFATAAANAKSAPMTTSATTAGIAANIGMQGARAVKYAPTATRTASAQIVGLSAPSVPLSARIAASVKTVLAIMSAKTAACAATVRFSAEIAVPSARTVQRFSAMTVNSAVIAPMSAKTAMMCAQVAVISAAVV